MSKVRVDRAAIAAGALIVGLYTMIAAHLAARANHEAIWSIDRMVIVTIGTAAVYAVIFAVGNRLLRRRAWRSRAAYVALGTASALPAFAAGVGFEFFSDFAARGSLSLALLRPALAGAIAGFLYRRSAGFEVDGDDPAALAALVGSEAHDDEPSGASSGTMKTPTAEYFDGPLQVRFSFMSALIAALTGSTLHVLVVMLGLIGEPLPAEAMPPTFASPGRAAVLGIIGLAIPYLVFVVIAAKALKRTGRTTMLSFALTGAVIPLALGFALMAIGPGPFGLIFAAQYIVPMAAAMAAYRSLAGLEPRSLPEDIEVTDRRTLIGADHVRRRVARVIDAS